MNRTRFLIAGIVGLAIVMLTGGVARSNDSPRPAGALDPQRSTLSAAGSTLTSAPTPIPPHPTALPPPTSNPPPRAKLLFTGDINPSRCVASAVLASGDYTLPFQAVAPELRAADLTIGSLDGSLSDLGPPTACDDELNLNLLGPARLAEGLQFAGFDVITVATNHAKNCGQSNWMCDQALFDTLGNLRAAGIQPVGGGADARSARAPVILERGGVRFAFLAASQVGSEMWAGEHTPGTAPLSPATASDLLAAIAAARLQAEVVIVLPQWGEEYELQPSQQQWEWAGQMIAAGATLVVGNQPHVVQAVEEFPTGLVAYALGNFVFDQGPALVRREGVVLEVDFQGATLAGWSLHPLRIYDQYQPRWVAGAEAQAILERVADSTAALEAR